MNVGSLKFEHSSIMGSIRAPEDVAVRAVGPLVEDRSQAQRALEAAECRFQPGEHDVNLPDLQIIQVQPIGPENVAPDNLAGLVEDCLSG